MTELVGKMAITTESGETYFVNGVCSCKAFANGMICKHRVAYRIVALYNESPETAPAPRIVRSIERDPAQRRETRSREMRRLVYLTDERIFR